ncbi:MAG: hypothetical protein ACOCWJ_04335 [Verrucomicrobiota bacterium]
MSAPNAHQQSPNTVDGRLPRGHRHTLAETNRSFYIARRDAAYTQITEFFRHGRRPKSKDERANLYQTCDELLTEAIMGTRRSQLQDDSLVIHYLQLLEETISACLSLVRHEIKLEREAHVFSAKMGGESVRELQSATDVFNTSETNIMDCIDGLMRFGTPIMEADTKQILAQFSAQDRERYNTTLEEYQTVYANRWISAE